MVETVPSRDEKDFALQIEGAVRDEKTGALWIHKDYVPARADWEIEQHIAPVKAGESFGDVESWADYVQRFAGADVFAPLLTWNSQGLRAVLDYHDQERQAGRCQWVAQYPFTRSPEWLAWERFANGTARSQRDAIEILEDLGEDVVEPTETELTQMLRELRANATARADTELRPDGTSSISFTKDTSVSNKAGTMDLPPVIEVAIPVLSGDQTRYKLRVRMRVTVDDNAKLTFRFSMVNAERVLEAVYAERVKVAQDLLADGFVLLRAAG